MERPRVPGKGELELAKDKLLPDVLAPGLRVLLVGINPGLYSAAIGCHFGRPGNRFWPTLWKSGWTPRLFNPWDQFELPSLGLGLTNICPRASARADELSDAELHAGAKLLTDKVKRYEPRFVAVLGVTAYRDAFQRPKSKLGEQPERIGTSRVWVLPNPSGLNAHYQGDDLVALFREFRDVVEAAG